MAHVSAPKLFAISVMMVTVALSGCISSSKTDDALEASSLPGAALLSKLTFLPEVLIDGGHRGGEPSILVDDKGAYYVSAPAGMVTTVFNTILLPQTAPAMGPQNRQSFIWK